MRSVDLFSGCGGLALGVHRGGFTAEVVSDWDRWACSTLQENVIRNYPLMHGVHVWEGDVRNIDWASISDGIDLVSCGPPCQPFSSGGKGFAAADKRDMFPATIEAIRDLKPRAFIVENVRGLTRPAFREYFSYIQLRLTHPEMSAMKGETWDEHFVRLHREHRSVKQDLQYNVQYSLLNAADFGVPQQRWRVFLVGFRSDVDANWSFPRPTHSAASLREIQHNGLYWDRHKIPKQYRNQSVRISHHSSLKPWRTVRDAICDLPAPLEDGSDEYFNHTLQLGARIYPGHTGSYIDAPAKALKAGVHGVPGGENILRNANGSIRYFTVREAARLQTFPDGYYIQGPWSEAMRQLGNAVPVILAENIALSVREHLDRAALSVVAHKLRHHKSRQNINHLAQTTS